MKEQTLNQLTFSRKQEIHYLAMVSLFWFAQYVYIPYQTTFLTASGASSAFTGMVVGAYGISQLLLRFPIGLCADSVGRHKYFIMAGAIASGTASVFRVFWCNGAGFLAANFFSGLASAMWISFMVFYTNHFSARDQQAATSRIVLFNNFGMLLGFLCSTITYHRIGMAGICLLSVCAGLLAFLLSAGIKERDVKPSIHKTRELLSVCKIRHLWMFSVIALIQQGIQLTTAMSFTNQILKSLGATDWIVGISSVIYMISSVGFAAFAASGTCSRKGPRFWIPLVFAVVALYCILVPAAGSVPVILLLQILPGMSTGILFSFATSEAMQEIPAGSKSTAMGLYQAVYALGMTTFPIFTGALASRAGILKGYLLLAWIACMGGIGAAVYYKRKAANQEAGS
ncbi:MFS transporter [Lacrimispora sp.]|uniref:MFS transporter n=1 Tax=Lacrimispora sp. TaxID=2719234 RepID=UPI002897BF56|nr:MFS transporter [Lacrimispora sp.]